MTALIAQILLLLTPVGSPAVAEAPGKDIKVVDYAGLEAYLAEYSDKTLVVNFWATWCVPCVKELPYFEELTAKYDDDELVVVLVSLDFTSQIDKRLKPFLAKHQLKSKVILLDDPDQNVWIDKVDPSWSGAIPVTFIRKNGKQKFFEGSFEDYNDLNTFIQSFINS